MVEFLFLDLDDTIFDFQKAERIALAKTIRDFGLEPTEDVLHRYHLINKWHWEQLELGNLTRQEVLENRFGVLFQEFGLEADKAACAKAYGENLAIGHYYLPGAEEALKNLSKKYRLYLASNGTASVQRSRMDSANFYHFFENIFISQEIGHNKPSKAYFDACFARIPGFDPEKAIMVGDSLSSDILGGKNAGIATCWVNPSHAPAREDVKPDHVIESIARLPELLEKLEESGYV